MQVNRRAHARALRERTAELAFVAAHPDQVDNGEDYQYPGRIASFTKGLPHDGDPRSDTFGEVLPTAYATLTRALSSGDPVDFEAIAITRPDRSGSTSKKPPTRKLVNPQAGLAYDTEGMDTTAVSIPPAPRIDSEVVAGEMAELYWMALLRDVAFRDYGSDPRVTDAAAELSTFGDFGATHPVTPDNIFRGITPGDGRGPYLSQFMLHDVTFGTIRFPQRQQTVLAGTDHMFKLPDWVAVQNGEPREPNPPEGRDPIPRYIRNLRDLAHYVHFDALYEAYLLACLILLDIDAPVDPGNPYAGSATQVGFGTFGGPHILSLVTEVATRALKAVWYQKWFVHRRLRPEAYGGLVDMEMNYPGRYPMLPRSLVDSQVVKEVEKKFGSYLLPQAFPEGSPVHPAYGAGHATVAGACVSILKAWFDDSHVAFHGSRCKCPRKSPRSRSVLVPSPDGTELEKAKDSPCLTVGDELNKVAANIALGRNGGGVHWRSDYTQSIRLGEQVALSVLRDQASTYNENPSLRLTCFNGTSVAV